MAAIISCNGTGWDVHLAHVGRSAWAQRNIPDDIIFGIRSYVSTLIARITKDIGFLTMQQAVALCDVGHIARGAALAEQVVDGDKNLINQLVFYGEKKPVVTTNDTLFLFSKKKDIMHSLEKIAFVKSKFTHCIVRSCHS